MYNAFRNIHSSHMQSNVTNWITDGYKNPSKTVANLNTQNIYSTAFG